MFGFRKKDTSPTIDQVDDVLPSTNKYQQMFPKKSRDEVISAVIDMAMPVKPRATMDSKGATMDFNDPSIGFGQTFGTALSDTHLTWFGSHSFIGYQACAIFAQHWLVDAACTIPVDDSIRKGWKLTKNDGEEIDIKTLNQITQIDKRYNITNKLREFAKFGRVYGVRVAIFQVESNDPKYYELPFNIDGVKPGSFRGVLMTDPYYTIPLLTGKSTDPNSPDFYEPEFWLIGGKKYHKSHCIVFRHSEVAQILKPSYIYGGVSLTQQIFEAVYNAEITATEVPQLIQNMRTYVYKMDLARALQDPQGFNERLGAISEIRNNYGIQAISLEDELSQLQTALSGLDELVLGRYQIVASVAQMPIVKLMKTPMAGGLADAGKGEESIYHETLESLQTKMLPFLERYYQLIAKSEFNSSFAIDVVFNKLDAMTEKEQAETNKVKADTAAQYVTIGALDGQDVREAIIADPQSGFNGIDPLKEVELDIQEDENGF